jgi:DNA-binding GntR family transcriptional regulator
MKGKEPSILDIHRETLVDRLVQVLQESIFSGKRLPKTRISEVGVAKEFGISRIPAREALQRLEEMNLVRKNHFGREIVQFSRDEFAQIYELKNVVEAFGAMKGCLNASSQEINKIKKILVKMGQVLSCGDMDQLKLLGHEFHDSMVYCCNNKKTIDTFLSLARQIRWATSLSLYKEDRPAQSYGEHKEIFTAFQRKEAETVRTLIENHSNLVMNRILSQMESQDKNLSG